MSRRPSRRLPVLVHLAIALALPMLSGLMTACHGCATDRTAFMSCGSGCTSYTGCTRVEPSGITSDGGVDDVVTSAPANPVTTDEAAGDSR